MVDRLIGLPRNEEHKILGHAPFYNETIKKITSAFGTIFSDIKITRTVENTTPQTVIVPLSYASKDKAFARQEVDPTMNYNMGRVFPAIAFQMTGLNQDPTRSLSPTQYIAQQTSGTGSTGTFVYAPAAWNIEYELYIGASNIEDSLQILEQILPFFNPAYTITTNDWPTLGIEKDVPIILNSVSYTDNTPESDFITDRIIEWTLSFTVKAYIYGPSRAAKPIKTVQDFIYSQTPVIQQAEIIVAVNPTSAAPSDTYTIDTTKIEVTG